MRYRKPKTVRVSRGCLSGQGATKTEARADLDKQIDAALQFHSPIIECWHGYTVFVAATPTGWTTYVFRPDELEHGARRIPCSHSFRKESDTVISARMHAAQCAWTLGCNDDAAFADRSGLGDKARELTSWMAWQRRYAEAVARGAADAEARDIAGGLKPMRSADAVAA